MLVDFLGCSLGTSVGGFPGLFLGDVAGFPGLFQGGGGSVDGLPGIPMHVHPNERIKP